MSIRTGYLEDRIQASYAAVPERTREDLYEALQWARETLTGMEGEGHEFHITSDGKNGMVCCSFYKPEWPGDHCGRGMESGSEAIVMAVCEYIEGS